MNQNPESKPNASVGAPALAHFVIAAVCWQFLFAGCTPSEPILRRDLENVSYKEVLGKFAKPVSEIEFTLNDNPLEYRRGLLDKIPKEMRTLQIVRESQWSRGDDILVVWFVEKDGSWVSVEAVQWDPKRIQF